MQLASSSTPPSSFGNPPYPTEVSLGSSSTTVTAAITASSVSPPNFKIAIPLSSACNPFALEIISGRFPCPAGSGATFAGAAAAAFADAALPSKFPAPATAPLASDVRKNFRRDHNPMSLASQLFARHYIGKSRARREIEQGFVSQQTAPSGAGMRHNMRTDLPQETIS